MRTAEPNGKRTHEIKNVSVNVKCKGVKIRIEETWSDHAEIVGISCLGFVISKVINAYRWRDGKALRRAVKDRCETKKN